jgi:hypothetical protein
MNLRARSSSDAASETDAAVRRYHQHLLLTRLLFLAGCGLVLIPAVGLRLEPGIMSPAVRDGIAVVGLVMLLAVFPLYRHTVNCCPQCRRSFSEAPEYAGDETPGVPLFQSIEKCPFCGVAL